jgi:hypothetical protein
MNLNVKFTFTAIACILFYTIIFTLVTAGAFSGYYIYDNTVESVKLSMIILWSIFGVSVFFFLIIMFFINKKTNDGDHIVEFRYTHGDSLMSTTTDDMVSV